MADERPPATTQPAPKRPKIDGGWLIRILEHEPTLSKEAYEDLTAEQKLKYVELLEQRRGHAIELKKIDQWAAMFKEAPNLINAWMAAKKEEAKGRSRIAHMSLWVHLGVLVVGTVAISFLGTKGVLEGQTIVALLGPLYTYVIVNLGRLSTPNDRRGEDASP